MSEQYRGENFRKHQEVVSRLSVVDITKVVDYINRLAGYIEQNSEVLNDLDVVVDPFIQVQDALRAGKECPKCGRYLFLSDIPGYEYVCPECDENFFECEV